MMNDDVTQSLTCKLVIKTNPLFKSYVGHIIVSALSIRYLLDSDFVKLEMYRNLVSEQRGYQGLLKIIFAIARPSNTCHIIFKLTSARHM